MVSVWKLSSWFSIQKCRLLYLPPKAGGKKKKERENKKWKIK